MESKFISDIFNVDGLNKKSTDRYICELSIIRKMNCVYESSDLQEAIDQLEQIWILLSV